MKFLSHLLLNLAIVAGVWGQPVLVGWQVTGQTAFGTQGMEASTIAPGITNSLGLTRGAGVGTSGSATSNAWGGNTWNYPTAAASLAANAYVTFGITVNLSYSASIKQISLNYRRSTTGPPNAIWQYQLNGGSWATIGDFSNQFPTSNSGSSITPIDLSGVTELQNLPAGTVVNFRIVPYGATSSGGTWYVYGSGTGLAVAGEAASLGAPGSGIGSATVSPAKLLAKQTADFTIKIASDDSATIAKIVVVVPPSFTWSMNKTDVTISGNSFSSAACAVSQDTISATGAAITQVDTGEIMVHSVTVPDSSMTAVFLASTAVDTAVPSPIMKLPRVMVTKLVRIIDLHNNDSQGVPAAPYGVGTSVTVCGIITANTSSSQTNLFLQDATGGINIFNYTYFDVFQVGDSVEFTGIVQQYRGTTEISPDSGNWTIYSRNNQLPEPLVLACSGVNQTFGENYSEPNESRLVRINNITYNASNSTITDVTGTTRGYISPTWSVPPGSFDVVGILKQYKGGTPAPGPPFLSDYEINPRTPADIISHVGPIFAIAPAENNLRSNSVTIDFKTAAPSSVTARYGKTQAYTDSVTVTAPDTIHSVYLGDLSPATVYHYQVSAEDADGINTTGDAIFSTSSPVGSSGRMEVYFNKPVDISVARGENAQTVDLAGKFIERIDSAKYSIDLALYSLSGSVGSTIASHLLSAKARGVKIRMIAENGNSDTSPMNTMKNSIPFITDAFDPVDAGAGLMHDKFAVFDFRDTTSFTDDWVWTGSWNATDPGNNDDAQNVIEIQDKALANAYTMEFNEMWGSSTDTPSASQSRFGSHKLDITPHKFNINGTPLSMYFSPSDQTTFHISEALKAATYSVGVCMLTFTRSDLSQELVAKKTAGDKVRVLLDNNTDTGNQYNFLQSNGIDIHLKGSDVAGYLHHKYVVIDAEDPDADQTVITGSHNWSTSAETSNDENVLIIHSKRIANLYLQEFKARYNGAGGTDNILLGVKSLKSDLPKSFRMEQNYPNPFNPSTTINYYLPVNSRVTLKLYDVLGREVCTLVDGIEKFGNHEVRFDGSRLSSGIYIYKIQAVGENGKSLTAVRKLILIK